MADANVKETEITPELEEDYRNTQIRLRLLREAHAQILKDINWEHQAFFARHPELKE